MKITKDDLLNFDFDTVFTRDPGRFIESLIINIAYASKDPLPGDTIARQRLVFEKWLGFYTNHIKETLLAELTAKHASHTEKLVTSAHRRGQIVALANLPFKPNLLGGDKVDLVRVNELIHQLRTQEAKGDQRHDNPSVASV